MYKLNYILKNINLLNLILIATIILLANFTFLPVFNKSVKFKLPPVKQTVAHKDEKVAESSIPSPSDYTMIADENLFHPERRIPAETSQAQPFEQPEFVLYGTMITDDVRLAYLEDLKAPHSTQGRGKRHSVVKIGDNMSGFTLKEIYPDKVIMVRGEDTVVVELSDSSGKKARGAKSASKKKKITPAQALQKQKAFRRDIHQLIPPIKRIPR